MPLTDEELRSFMKWQGKIDAVVKELNHNDDQLEIQLTTLWKAHTKCREEWIKAIVGLETVAKQAGKRWGMIVGFLSAAVAASIAGAIIHFL